MSAEGGWVGGEGYFSRSMLWMSQLQWACVSPYDKLVAAVQCAVVWRWRPPRVRAAVAHTYRGKVNQTTSEARGKGCEGRMPPSHALARRSARGPVRTCVRYSDYYQSISDYYLL